MDAARIFVAQLQQHYLLWLVVFATLTVVEFAFPLERHSPRSRASGLIYWLFLIPAYAVSTEALRLCWTAWKLEPLLVMSVRPPAGWPEPVAALVGFLAAAMLHDFFFYWAHRAQHRWLWRYHAVHHSIERMNAVNSYHHVSEGLVSTMLLALPSSLFIADTGPALPFAGLILWLHVVYLHSPTRVHAGPLRAVLADNRFHRIHHSVEPRHFDRNFGAFTTLWDRLFGTAYFPAKDEWPAVGQAEMPEPRSLGEWFAAPARYAATTDPPEAPPALARD